MDEDEELKRLEQEFKQLVSGTDSSQYGVDQPIDKENVYKFFKHILGLEDSWKVSNLKDMEIGHAPLGVRDYLDIAVYSDAEELSVVSQYLRNKAMIVSEPTMGRKGFLAQLFVTQIKKEQKMKEPTPERKKWFGFGGKKDDSE